MPKPGFVYIATNTGLPGHCKVGQTEHVERREKELDNQPGVKVEIVASVWVDDIRQRISAVMRWSAVAVRLRRTSH